MPFTQLTNAKRVTLEFEVVPAEARLEFTRMIRDKCSSTPGDESGLISLIRENDFVNIANTIMGRPIYALESDGWGNYEPAEFAWHQGQRELIMRVPSTTELVEILADYLQNNMLSPKSVNAILKRYNCGFRFKDVGGIDGLDITVIIQDEDNIPEPDLSNDHPNVRRLVIRMNSALAAHDYPGVLHGSASVFETLAKDVTQNPSVNDQTLASFFAGYRKKSLLPEPVLDYMLSVYNNRNTAPLAAHGSLSEPTVTPEEAVSLCELTKTIVRMERALAQQKVDRSQITSSKRSQATTDSALDTKPE
jgi:hypothetical protein